MNGKEQAITPPKTARGRRTVHLSFEHVAALRALRESQGATLELGHMRDGYLAVNAAGEPIRPERYSDLFREHCLASGVRTLTLHSLRHSSVTAMQSANVPLWLIAEQHGHDPAIAARIYSHPSAEDLKSAAQALDMALGGGRSGRQTTP